MKQSMWIAITIFMISAGSAGQYTEYKLDRRWSRIDSDKTQIVSYDSKSLSITPSGAVRAWIRFDFSPEARIAERKSRAREGQSTKGYELFVYTLYFWEFYCESQEQLLLRQVDYTGSGEVLDDVDTEILKHRPTAITSDSLGELMIEKVCEAAHRKR